jgi:NAD+ synthase (glutamine-hydrolysing)
MHDGFIKVASATPRIRVADPDYNCEQIKAMADVCHASGGKIIVFPELCITGYTCGDLFLQRKLLDGAENGLIKILNDTSQLDALIVVGLPVAHSGRLYNCAAVLFRGQLLGLVPKINIPNYSEFYEKRHFASGGGIDCTEIEFAGRYVPFGTHLLFRHEFMPELVVGCEICEDLWVPDPPSTKLALAGATVIVNPSASDETVTKDEYRRQLVAMQSARLICGYIYTSAGDGESSQDLVYTGHNLICENGTLLCQSDSTSGIIITELDIQKLDGDRRAKGTFVGSDSSFRYINWGSEPEQTELTRTFSKNPFVPDSVPLRAMRCEKVLTLQSLGLKKRIEHTNAKKLVIGVSGGLDSTLALLVSAKALDMLSRSRRDIIAVTMPCFGTTKRTRSNAQLLVESLGAQLRTVDITDAVNQHFKDIGHDPSVLNVVFENSQARERTQVIMDIANAEGGLVIGTGDLSELALGWATYNGDHMSMYAVNTGVPKTLVRYLVDYYADSCADEKLCSVLKNILDTPVSPELLPAENGEISQKTEDLVGPYELHDFFLYYAVRWGFSPKKVFRLAKYVFAAQYGQGTIYKWLCTFYRRFFSQQFKRSCLPDGPKVGSLTLSPRGDWRMPSDASSALWLKELDEIKLEGQ